MTYPFTQVTQLAMHEQIALYNLTLASDFGSWLWEPESDTLYYNEQYMRMLGYAPGQFPYHISTWEQLIHPDDRQSTVDTQRRVLGDPTLGDSFENRFRLLTASGEYIWIMGRGFVICRNEAGQAIRVSGMHLSLQKMEETTEQAALQHARANFAVEAAGDGLWDWDAQSGEVYYSPSYLSMLGYSRKEFPAHVDSWASRVHPEDFAATVEVQYACVASPAKGDTFECVYRFLAADGEYRWILGRGKVVRRDAAGKGTRILGLHTDITELRNVQEKLTRLLQHDELTRLHSRYFFDAVLDKLQPNDYPVSVIFADVDGLKLVNDHMGHPAGDKLLRSAADIMRASLPENAVIGRIGGDEFAILLRSCDQEQARELLIRLNSALTEHNASPGGIPIFMALGLVTEETTIPIHRLMARADKAMLLNKQQQRSQKQQHLKGWIERETGHAVTGTDVRTGH